MRRALLLCTALLLYVAPTANAAGGAVATPRVVGGTFASPASAPWQALVLPGPYLCGGSILDATHIVTAAHCVFDATTHTVTAPTEVRASAALTDRTASRAPRQDLTITDISVDPSYDPETYTDDAAVLTIGGAGIDLTGPDASAIALPPAGYAPPPSTDLQLSGWGTTTAYAPDQPNPDQASRYLKVATLRTSTGCAEAYADYDPQLELCAGEAGTDACQGDSGGPLAVELGQTWTLVGIVSSGAGCGTAEDPGLFTDVAADGVRAFLVSRGAGGLHPGTTIAPPADTSPPVITGTPQPGGRLTCDPGAWTGAGGYSYTFQRGDGHFRGLGADIGVFGTDVGTSVTCTVTATGPGGVTQATSAAVLIQAAPAAQGTAPTPSAQAPPTTAAAAPPATPHDARAPKATVTSARCGRTSCVLTVTVSDPAPNAGPDTLTGSLTTRYRARCDHGGHLRLCTRTTTSDVHPIAVGGGRYRVRVRLEHRGTQTFSFTATDRAGHRQARPTQLIRRT